MIVPAYFHPAVAAADWAGLPGLRPRAVILNIDSGPGAGADPQFSAVVSALGGVPVLGYVDSAYGARSLTSIEAEFAAYRSWYGVSGFLVDQAASDAERLGCYRALADTARTHGASLVAFNHGTYPDPAYADIADLLVTFEGPWAAYEQLYAPDWAMDLPASRFCHLVYATPPHEFGRARAQATRCNAGAVYVTDRGGSNPWDGLPSHVPAVEGAT